MNYSILFSDLLYYNSISLNNSNLFLPSYLKSYDLNDWNIDNPPKSLLLDNNNIEKPVLYLCNYDGGIINIYFSFINNKDSLFLLYKCYEFDICSIDDDIAGDPTVTYMNYNEKYNMIIIGMKSGDIIVISLNDDERLQIFYKINDCEVTYADIIEINNENYFFISEDIETNIKVYDNLLKEEIDLKIPNTASITSIKQISDNSILILNNEATVYKYDLENNCITDTIELNTKNEEIIQFKCDIILLDQYYNEYENGKIYHKFKQESNTPEQIISSSPPPPPPAVEDKENNIPNIPVTNVEGYNNNIQIPTDNDEEESDKCTTPNPLPSSATSEPEQIVTNTTDTTTTAATTTATDDKNNEEGEKGKENNDISDDESKLSGVICYEDNILYIINIINNQINSIELPTNIRSISLSIYQFDSSKYLSVVLKDGSISIINIKQLCSVWRNKGLDCNVYIFINCPNFFYSIILING